MTLVAANLAVPAPEGVDVVTVTTAAELREAVRAAAKDAEAVVMAAAVADFRPVSPADAKIKKRAGAQAPTIQLVETVDVLAELARDRLRPGQVVVGFAAETGDAHGTVLEHGRDKALRKGADLLVVNAVGDDLGFGTTDNDVTILDATGEPVASARGSKDEVADAVWDAVRSLG